MTFKISQVLFAKINSHLLFVVLRRRFISVMWNLLTAEAKKGKHDWKHRNLPCSVRLLQSLAVWRMSSNGDRTNPCGDEHCAVQTPLTVGPSGALRVEKPLSSSYNINITLNRVTVVFSGFKYAAELCKRHIIKCCKESRKGQMGIICVCIFII